MCHLQLISMFILWSRYHCPSQVVQVEMRTFLLNMLVNEILVVHIQNTFSWSSIQLFKDFLITACVRLRTLKFPPANTFLFQGNTKSQGWAEYRIQSFRLLYMKPRNLHMKQPSVFKFHLEKRHDQLFFYLSTIPHHIISFQKPVQNSFYLMSVAFLRIFIVI